MSAKDRQALLEGAPVVGHFWMFGSTDAVGGVLRWSATSGASLELVDAAPDFPRDFESPGFVVHGITAHGGDVTLMDCMLRQLALGDQPRRVSAATLAWGALISPRDRWPRSIFATANLSEWRNDTGFDVSRPASRRRAPGFSLRWKPPTSDAVRVAGANLTFRGRYEDSGLGGGPDLTIRTWQEMVVAPDRPLTIAKHLSTYGLPLLALTAFACDRPDATTVERYFDPRKSAIEVWRQGRTVQPRLWREQFLFEAFDLRDYAKSVRAWWVLHRKVWPALGLFGDHLLHDTTYSAERFLTVYSALEVYGRVRHKSKKLEALRRYADVDSTLIGCTDPALKLIGKTRGYFAHFDNVASKADREEIEDNLMESTRRVAALMQACLLRELGFSQPQREALLRRHYRTWPLAR